MIKNDLIIDAINTGYPIAFTRYGDGESMILNCDNNIEDAKFILKRQLGYIPQDHHIKTIRDNLIYAYQNSDIIGMPESHHLNREDNWSIANEIFKKYVGEINPSVITTSVDLFYQILENNEFGKLLQNREVVNYISCRNLDKELKSKFSIKKINSFIIAPEMKFTSNYKGERHYPEQYNIIGDWMISNHKNINNSICLVGAGVVGKIYNNWFKDLGGISLDIGGVFDLWAGRVTRGKNRGMDVIDETYKL